MDIYSIINSQSIGEYLRGIEYKFDPLQAAFLIWYSKRLTLKEKHALWSELIDTMPDTPIEKRRNTIPQDSLHEYLKRYMSVENAVIERFYSAESNCFYTYDFYCHGDGSWCENNGLYKTVDACLAALETDRQFNIKHIKLSKKYIDENESHIDLYMNPSMEIICADTWRILSEEEDDILCGVFEGLWFEIPHPFKKGDILQRADCPYDIRYCFDPYEESIVLEDDLIPSERLSEIFRKDGDISDMTLWGIFCNDVGKFYHECTHTYLDFELQYKPLKKHEKPMLPLSNYLKGEISVDILCNAYHVILSEMQAEGIRRVMNITEEGLTLAGLNKS